MKHKKKNILMIMIDCVYKMQLKIEVVRAKLFRHLESNNKHNTYVCITRNYYGLVNMEYTNRKN